MSECQRAAKEFIQSELDDPEIGDYSIYQCWRGWHPKNPLFNMPITYGYVFFGLAKSRYQYKVYGSRGGLVEFNGVVMDYGDGPKVIRYCLPARDSEHGICIPRMVQGTVVTVE